MSNPQTYIYKVLDWGGYDADSLDLTLDLGFDLQAHFKVRIMGIDTTELRDRRPEFKALAYLAKTMAWSWLKMAQVRGEVYFSSENYAGKFGRKLGDMLDCESNRLTDFLIRENLAVPYHGQNKKDVEDEQVACIAHWRGKPEFEEWLAKFSG